MVQAWFRLLLSVDQWGAPAGGIVAGDCIYLQPLTSSSRIPLAEPE